MGKKSAPAPPDYTGAAKEQSAASQQLTTQQTWANRPDIQTPWGSQTWNAQVGTDPSTGQPITRWESQLRLSDSQQRALDDQQAIQEGRSAGALGLLSQATGNFQSPMDWNSLPQRPENPTAPQLNAQNLPSGQVMNRFGPQQAPLSTGPGAAPVQTEVQATPLQSQVQGQDFRQFVPNTRLQSQLRGTPGAIRQAGQQAVMDFQAPILKDRRSDVENQLANQGLSRGSEAWNREMRSLGDEEARAGLQAFSAGRAEADSLFGQELQSGQFRNAAAGQQFQQNLAQGSFENQARGKQFETDLLRGQFFNSAGQQQFQQNLASAGLYNQAQDQQFRQGVTSAQLNNAAAGQDFSAEMSRMQMENSAGQQEMENMLRLAQAGDQRALAAFNAQLQGANFANQNRQQAIAEDMGRRGQSLNELNALLTGQQVATPQMPSFNTAGRGETPQLLNAANMGYQAQLDGFNARQQMGAGAMNGLFSLGSAAMGNPAGWAGLFNFGK
jgi:hypothetical protein